MTASCSDVNVPEWSPAVPHKTGTSNEAIAIETSKSSGFRATHHDFKVIDQFPCGVTTTRAALSRATRRLSNVWLTSRAECASFRNSKRVVSFLFRISKELRTQRTSLPNTWANQTTCATLLGSTTGTLIQSRELAPLPRHSGARGGCEKCFHPLPLGTVTLHVVVFPSRIRL